MTIRHEPVITDALAGCSCKRWAGPARLSGETQGSYTVRANEAHREHAERFGFQSMPMQTAMFNPQPGLFE